MELLAELFWEGKARLFLELCVNFRKDKFLPPSRWKRPNIINYDQCATKKLTHLFEECAISRAYCWFLLRVALSEVAAFRLTSVRWSPYFRTSNGLHAVIMSTLLEKLLCRYGKATLILQVKPSWLTIQCFLCALIWHTGEWSQCFLLLYVLVNDFSFLWQKIGAVFIVYTWVAFKIFSQMKLPWLFLF